MNHEVKLLYCLLLSGVFSFWYCDRTIGQDKLNMSIGIGLPELLNVGARYQLKQLQIGIGIGSLPVKNESLLSVSGDVYYHFGGVSALSDRRPWYGRIGLNYLRDETRTLVDKFVYLNVKLGRDFNISKKFGMEVDSGIIIELNHDQMEKQPSNGFGLNLDFPLKPSIGVALFYRL